MLSIPKTEEQELTYCKDGKPLYIITRVIKSGTYKLYQCMNKGYLPLKTRRNNPLFKEVNNVINGKDILKKAVLEFGVVVDND